MAGPSQIWLRGRGLGAGCGDMPGIGEPMTPDPRTRDMPDQLKLVPTVWAQRATNGWYAALRASSRVAVDGVAGTRTLNALKDIQTRILADIPASSPVPQVPQIADSGHIAISQVLFNELTSAIRVADPAGSTVGLCDWSPVPRTSMNVATSTGVATVPAPSDALPVASPASDWTSAVGAGDWIVPAIAFVVSAGIGVALMKFAPKRRRKR